MVILRLSPQIVASYFNTVYGLLESCCCAPYGRRRRINHIISHRANGSRLL